MMTLSLVALCGAFYYSGIGNPFSSKDASADASTLEPQISVEQLAKIQLQPLTNNPRTHNIPHFGEGDPSRIILAENLWQINGVIFFVIRRPGCSLCREEAQELTSLFEQLNRDTHNKTKLQLVGIVHESLGVEAFSQKYFSGHQIYHDASKGFFRALGNRWLGFSGYFNPTVWRHALRAWWNGVEGNTEGEGRLLGGVIVVSPPTPESPAAVIFQHEESVWGDHADMDKLRFACEKIQKIEGVRARPPEPVAPKSDPAETKKVEEEKIREKVTDIEKEEY